MRARKISAPATSSSNLSRGLTQAESSPAQPSPSVPVRPRPNAARLPAPIDRGLFRIPIGCCNVGGSLVMSLSRSLSAAALT